MLTSLLLNCLTHDLSFFSTYVTKLYSISFSNCLIKLSFAYWAFCSDIITTGSSRLSKMALNWVSWLLNISDCFMKSRFVFWLTITNKINPPRIITPEI